MKNRKRNRMKGFDYSSNNIYFATICVQNMVCCLGEIIISEGVGSDKGASRDLPVLRNNGLPVHDGLPNIKTQKMVLNRFGLVVDEQLRWLENQYKYVILHNFVVMPNHVHAIIEIDSLKIKYIAAENAEENVIKIKSLSSLIGAFKTTSSKKIHELGFLNFSWKRSFHDSIISNKRSYTNRYNYIDNNPQQWVIK